MFFEVHGNEVETKPFVCVGEELLSELTSRCEDGTWQVGISGFSWECPLEFVFLFLTGASSPLHPRRSVFLTSYWSPTMLINMGKRLLSPHWEAGGCCLTLRRCLNGIQGMIHLAQNHIFRAGIHSISSKCLSQREEKVFMKVLHLATIAIWECK